MNSVSATFAIRSMRDHRPATDVDSVPSEQLARVDEICDRFLTSWRNDESPRIEEFLPEPSDPAHDIAFAELLHTEIELTSDAGNSVDIVGLHQRFPEKSEVIAELCGQLDETLSPKDVSTSLPLPVAKQPGQASDPLKQIGRYRIERTLGRGGMGTVYLARDEKLDRPVALKVPHFEGDGVPQLVERFEREARTMAAIRHPNLCTVFDVGNIDGFTFLTMEYVDGSTLSRRLRKGPVIEPRAAVEMVGKVARALQLAHESGVVHRDLKPANILLRGDEPVVTDFGLARRVAIEMTSDDGSADDSLTAVGTVVGTPAYMSPEQAEGVPGTVGPASDIYSLGVILYELLAGRVPFDGTVTRVIGCHIAQEPEAPSVNCLDIDPQLEQICLKTLAKKPDERFASAGEFADALEASLAPAAKPNWVARSLFAATAVMLLAAVMTVLTFRTEQGTLVVEIGDPQILATTDGVELTLRDRKTGINYTVGPGPHELPLGDYTVRVKSDSGLDVDATEFRLVDGEDMRLTIRMKPKTPESEPPQAESELAQPPKRIPSPAFSRGDPLPGNLFGTTATLADFDDDGDLDAFVGGSGKGVDSRLYFNDGTGSFVQVALPKVVRLNSVNASAGADLDGDGDIDLFLGRNNDLPDLVLLNDGTGLFQLTDDRLGEARTDCVRLADFDGDHDIDAFVFNRDAPAVLWLNDGTGRFSQSSQEFDSPTSERGEAAVADFDSDGDLDVFCTSTSSNTRIWWNNGKGQFTAGEVFTEFENTWRVVAGDLNADRRPDAVVRENSQGVLIGLQTDAGWHWTPIPETDSKDHWRVALADMDGDEALDLILVNKVSAQSQVLINNGRGEFTQRLTIPGIRKTLFLATGDLDGDGDLDLLEAGADSEAGLVFENRLSEGRPAEKPPAAPFRTSGRGYEAGRVNGCDLADIDGDGDLDLIVVNGYEQRPSAVWINDGTGDFEMSEQALPVAFQCTFGDVDGDGDPDLWLTRRPEPDLVLLNDGRGTFTDTGQLLGAQKSFAALLVDLDGDDDLDCFLTNGVYDNNYQHPRYNEVLINDGQGRFADSGQKLGSQFSWSSTACDIDADGDLDICTSNVTRKGRTQFWMNDGHGHFEAGHAFHVESMSAIAGDMNGDGLTDVVLGVEWTRNRVYLTDDTASFRKFQNFGNAKTSEVLLTDFDDDGDLDVLVASRLQPLDPKDDCQTGIWWNDGEGNLSDPWHWSTLWVTDACVGDLDGDGDIDVVLGNEDGLDIEFNQLNP